MKQLIYMCMSAILLLCGCNNESEEIIPVENKEEYVDVKIGIGGEILEISQEPLTKGLTSDDLTWIQVYRVYSNSNVTDPYAYGLFDNVGDISLLLSNKEKYRIIAKTIINGKNRVYNEDGYYDMGYEYKQKITNSFEYSKDVDWAFLYFSGIGLEDGKSYFMPEIDSYYGELRSFSIQESNSCLIEMERQTCAVKICTKGLEEGDILKVMFGGNEKYISSDEVPFEGLFAIPNDGTPMETETFYFILERNGVEQILDKRDITLGRNKRTLITVNIPAEGSEDDMTKTSMDFVYDETPMEDLEEIEI